MTSFPGFSKRTITFLRNLSKHNDRDWFRDHRDDYERYWLEPAQEFVLAAASQLRRLDRGIQAEPRVDGSSFRINRDTRFSKDKRPYKDHMDLWFWEGNRKEAVSGYYLRLTGKSFGLGAGAHRFDRDRLGEYRDAVVDSKRGASLRRAVLKVEKAGWKVFGEHYKTVPRGYDASGVTAGLIRHNALWVGEQSPIPAVVFTPEVVPHCIERWRTAAPIHRWLTRHLGSA